MNELESMAAAVGEALKARGETVMVGESACGKSTLGRSLLRVANTGISGVIGPDGIMTQASPQFEIAVMRVAVTARTGLTPYARFGDNRPNRLPDHALRSRSPSVTPARSRANPINAAASSLPPSITTGRPLVIACSASR